MATQTVEPVTLVLIEDTLDDEHLALRALRLTGLPLLVRVARDGERGLRALGLSSDPKVDRRRSPDLVISDLKMPKMNGDEVLQLARADEDLAEVPFVIFSSSGEAKGIEHCMELGATEYAVKPVDYDNYMECLRKLVLRYVNPAGRPSEICLPGVG